MPTIFRHGPYRFFFYAGDQHEPPHIHVERDDNTAKFWLDPIRNSQSRGFPAHQLREIESIIWDNRKQLQERWNEFFNR